MGRAIDIVCATEHLVPAVGGAERFLLEALDRLAGRHRVRALWLAAAEGSPAGLGLPAAVRGTAVEAPSSRAGYWVTKRRRSARLASAVAVELQRAPADVVLTALHAAPEVAAAARAAGAATVLLLPSYESLCKYAFDARSRCSETQDCSSCPAAQALGPDEREALRRSREAQGAALAGADGLLAVSAALARSCQAWSGRRPEVVFPFGSAPEPPAHLAPRVDGPLTLIAARWSANKGAHLLPGLARALSHRAVRITEPGLEESARRILERQPNVTLVHAPATRVLAGAGLLLVPSQWDEPFGRLALEGLAAGVPTLTSARGGLGEFVPAGQLVDPPGSIEAWAEAVRRLEDPTAWHAAQRTGIDAARRVMATDPFGRLEAALGAAAGGAVRPRPRA